MQGGRSIRDRRLQLYQKPRKMRDFR